MVRRLSLLVVLSVIAALPHFADAADAAFKVGYVDSQLAMVTVEQGKREKEKLKKDFEGKQKKLDAMQEELKKLKEDFDKQAPMMKEDTRNKKQGELQGKFVELQQTYVGLQKEISEKEQAAFKEIFSRMKVVIDKIGDRENYTLILDRNEANVLYYKRHMDITDEVVKAYNAQYK